MSQKKEKSGSVLDRFGTAKIATLTPEQRALVPTWARGVHSVPQGFTIVVAVIIAIVLYSVVEQPASSLSIGVILIVSAMILWRADILLRRAQEAAPEEEHRPRQTAHPRSRGAKRRR